MNSLHKTIHYGGNSLKFRLPCEDNSSDWLTIKRYLGEKQFNVLLGSLQNYKEVVIKFGREEEINQEYQHSLIAYENKVPNFIGFLCRFSCEDNIESIKTRHFEIEPFICKNPGSTIGVIVMPYYPLGNLQQYPWNRSNFSILKNILLQIGFALLTAYERFQFIHNDLHVGNILLRKSKKTQLQYEHNQTIHIMGIYPMVMDFGRSYQAKDADFKVYSDINRLLTVTKYMDASDLVLDYNDSELQKWSIENRKITASVYEDYRRVIDNIKIHYCKSERPVIRFSYS